MSPFPTPPPDDDDDGSSSFRPFQLKPQLGRVHSAGVVRSPRYYISKFAQESHWTSERPSGLLSTRVRCRGTTTMKRKNAEVLPWKTRRGREQPARTSLMALLAETDRQMGLEGSAYTVAERRRRKRRRQRRRKRRRVQQLLRVHGETQRAAFIPCGHTFCRLCSRELWVQRGNCPLCNNYILEILDIF
ncbi:hypothetical protein Sango_1859800 [Sesamum angolense]|uniref:RING-type domain-containing protein n=1 Tax=Sesamum angolense TaxID=2727404 RepID=A0AAE2BQL6_9LAMI|nr:hypothetical protein Sango_1859800 [Sesamum angolense]